MIILSYIALAYAAIHISHIISVTFKSNKKHFDLYYIYVIISTISYLLIPALNEYYEYSRNSVRSSNNAKFSYFLYITIFLFSTILLQPVFYRLRNLNTSKHPTPINNNFYFLFFVIALIPFSTSISAVLEIISRYGFDIFLADRISLLAGQAYTSVFILFIPLVACSYLLDKYFIQKTIFRFKYFLLSVLWITTLSLPMILLGGRTNLFVGVIILLLSIVLLYKRQNRIKDLRVFYKIGLALIVLVAFAANLLGEIRQSAMSQTNDYSLIKEQEIPLEGVVVSLSSYENMFILFDKNFNDFEGGSTIFSSLTGFIPRSIYPNKPVGAGPVMKNIIAPNSYNLIGGEFNTSVTTGLPTEGFINFGWLGSLIIPLILLPIIIIASNMAFLAKNAIEIITSSLIILRVLAYPNGEFFGVSTHIISALLFLMLYKLISLFFRVFSNKSEYKRI